MLITVQITEFCFEQYLHTKTYIMLDKYRI